jgi:hypothetical protein
MAALTVIALLAAIVAVVLGTTRPAWTDSAYVMFLLPRSQHEPRAYYLHSLSLITSEEAFSQVLENPAQQPREGAAGQAADVSMQLVNFYNEEYPEYPEPLAALTSAAPSAAGARQGFTAAAGRLRRVLAGWQARDRVPRRDRIRAQILAASGPQEHRGSLKRGLGGLAVLTAMAAVTAWRRPGRGPARAPLPAGAVPRARQA